ncbi:monovalent cation/H(+) antiporter subunit G [Tateyamaria sp. syn59]|uniref:monovalent cation/H(+) antiporter subunit G n=1 Tax=Tateyamaria sp. syn59 TaxID=2576942 RepID=UPI0011BD9822|nr:monovalent cation/H(+) antiporter subunit G [Tateyamaria sp. syn59]
MIDLSAAFLVFLGAAMTVAAGIGVLRLPDVFTRMHAATKVGTLGSGLIMAGAALHFADPAIILRCVLIVFFLLLTAPIGAHMIGRASLRLGITPWSPKQSADSSQDTTRNAGG